MLNINYFKAIQNAVGNKHLKDTKVNETIKQFGDRFDNSINVEYDVTRNDVQQTFIITPKTNDKNKCDIVTRPNEELNMGDIIYWHKLHWIVTDKEFDNSIYNIGEMTRCNRTIKWQNPDTLKIIERWCLVEKPYTSNIKENDYMSLSQREYQITIPYDNETKLIDIDRRFMLEIINGKPRTYSVTCVDTNTNRYQDIEGGFLVWNLTQDQSEQPNDNIELEICDYVKSLNTNTDTGESDGDLWI